MLSCRALIFIVVLSLTAGLGAGCKNDPAVTARVEAARARNDGPPIWRVRKPGADTAALGTQAPALYLYGAVHLLPPDSDWMRADIEAILAKSGTVFFEVPRDEAAQNAADSLTARYGYTSSGQTLPQRLDGYEQKLLLAAALNADLSPQAFDRLEPWLASDMIALAALQKAGLTAQGAPDAVLLDMAQKSGKNIAYLETMEEHLIGSATLPEAVQMQALRDTLVTVGDLPAQASRLNAAWLAGDAQAIDQLIITPYRARAPLAFAALFEERNTRWAQKLSRFVDNEGSGAAIVGVGHLVGPGSLTEKLRAQGYEVERYFAARGENVIKTIPLRNSNP